MGLWAGWGGGGGSLTGGGGGVEWCLVEERGLQLIIRLWRNLQTVIFHIREPQGIIHWLYGSTLFK